MLLQFTPIIVSVVALFFSFILSLRITRKKVENQKAREISDIIHKGALTFLNKEYRFLLFFIIAVGMFLFFFMGGKSALVFVSGAVLSALSGNIGMRIATSANVRAAEGCKESIKKGLDIAFTSGGVMGLTVVGLGLLGVSLFYLILKDPLVLYGFGFGASSVALFARVGGGIYTKAADVGADLVGKIEAGIPEDDPRNPATIADNVGDNVGDVAGMGADLFESYVDAIIAAMILGFVGFALKEKMVILPLFLASAGIIASILGYVFVKLLSSSDKPAKIMNRGIWFATLLMIIFSLGLVKFFDYDMQLFYAFLAGLGAGIIIGNVTEYYTSSKYKPTQNISLASKAGVAPNIISGFALGLKSTLVPIIIVSGAIFFAYVFGGVYGIAIAGVGMLSTLGITLAADTYGPVADNAAGIAEMSGMGGEVRKRAEELDEVGNTTAAIGKGFAIGSAALTALVLMVSYGEIVGLSVINVLDYKVIIGLFLGGLMPFIFSSFALSAVGRAAMKMVEEVRRQFREIKGILEGTARPEYEKAIDISTSAALKEMILPGMLAVFVPVAVGFLFGVEALGGFLAGSIVTGFLLAITMSNSGGAWDNAKKFIEAGNFGGKGSDTHKAAVVGDTVGDPFKDTAGPSLNILLKLMAIVAIMIAPLL